MGSSPPVCSFTASLIQVAHVESRCATIIYVNGIENFLLRGREKKRERVRNGDAARRERRREKGRTIEDTDKGERRREKERATEAKGDCAGGQGAADREDENVLEFYVSNYMKDGITQPTDRPTEPTLA